MQKLWCSLVCNKLQRWPSSSQGVSASLTTKQDPASQQQLHLLVQVPTEDSSAPCLHSSWHGLHKCVQILMTDAVPHWLDGVQQSSYWKTKDQLLGFLTGGLRLLTRRSVCVETKGQSAFEFPRVCAGSSLLRAILQLFPVTLNRFKKAVWEELFCLHECFCVCVVVFCAGTAHCLILIFFA